MNDHLAFFIKLVCIVYLAVFIPNFISERSNNHSSDLRQRYQEKVSIKSKKKLAKKKTSNNFMSIRYTQTKDHFRAKKA